MLGVEISDVFELMDEAFFYQRLTNPINIPAAAFAFYNSLYSFMSIPLNFPGGQMQVYTFDWDGVDARFGTDGMLEFPDLLIYFSDRDVMPEAHAYFRQMAPEATLFGCSTGGQFSKTSLSESKLVAAAIKFDDAYIRSVSQTISEPTESRQVGRSIGQQLAGEGLVGIMLLSDGTLVNGSEVAAGVSEGAGSAAPVIGGLAGDGADFKTTLVGLDATIGAGLIAAVGFYGPSIRMGYGSGGGWTVMGPKRKITRSDGNVLYELDGKPALDLYEKYLGDEAADLPASALSFPLEVTAPGLDSSSVVRTIVNIDRESGSLIFAGNVPQGSVAQMMKASQGSLTRGACDAARIATEACVDGQLAIIVSCIGRSWVLGQHAEDEIEAVDESLGGNIPHIGFYSYGEICPTTPRGLSQLHNQSMTVSVISESLEYARA